MSPSGPGQRSTDPRIHCRHRTQRNSESVGHDGGSQTRKLQSSSLKAKKSMLKSKCQMSGSGGSGESDGELKRDPVGAGWTGTSDDQKCIDC